VITTAGASIAGRSGFFVPSSPLHFAGPCPAHHHHHHQHHRDGVVERPEKTAARAANVPTEDFEAAGITLPGASVKLDRGRKPLCAARQVDGRRRLEGWPKRPLPRFATEGRTPRNLRPRWATRPADSQRKTVNVDDEATVCSGLEGRCSSHSSLCFRPTADKPATFTHAPARRISTQSRRRWFGAQELVATEPGRSLARRLSLSNPVVPLQSPALRASAAAAVLRSLLASRTSPLSLLAVYGRF
jgi:hypothetical protein